jgi:GNAT superfamily N-acetyltransferase
MIIRRFEARDAEKVSRPIIRNLETVNIRDYPRNVIDVLVSHNSPQRLMDDSKENTIVVAENGGRIVGTASLFDDRVKNVFVEVGAHGKGIGKALMKEIERIARNAKRGRCS